MLITLVSFTFSGIGHPQAMTPKITSVSPDMASTNQTVTVIGTGFGATQENSYVTFSDAGTNWGAPRDLATWKINSWSDTQITFNVPTPSGNGGVWKVAPNTTASVTVTVGNLTSNSAGLQITSAPVITSVTPTMLSEGQTATLTGSGFGTNQGNSYVIFSDAKTNWGAPGDLATWKINSWSDTQITFNLPGPSGDGGVWKVVPNTTATIAVTVAKKISNVVNLAISGSDVSLYTRGYDLARTGANLQETTLTPTNVNSKQFGKLFTVETDGEIYAQPLYVSRLNIADAVHNVVFVATMNNSIYAVDADTGAVLWTHNYGKPITASEVENDENIAQISGIGILSTPVIDPTTKRMYFVYGTEVEAQSQEYQLEAIDIITGNPVSKPVPISGTYTANSKTATFNATRQNQRSSLVLANGNVYFAFGSHEDQDPYQGWIFAYDVKTLAQIAVYADQTSGREGGIWMAGSAPAVDAAGNLYLSSGNGIVDQDSKPAQPVNSFIKLSPTLQLLDYFTPFNSAFLNANDMDLGSGGVLLVSNPDSQQSVKTYVVGGGKEGKLYLIDSNNLTKFDASIDHVIQEFQAVTGNGTFHIHGTPVYFDRSVDEAGVTSRPSIYLWGENDYLKGFQFDTTGGLLTPDFFARSEMTAPATSADGAMPGGFLSISSNQGQDGIIWASTPYSDNAVHKIVQGVLYAFDADKLTKLWSDKDNDARDEIGLFAKYCPPVVVNGKLFAVTFGSLENGRTIPSGQLVVYGLLP